MLKKMCLQMKKKNKGFTLIELIVVIAILGILAAVLIPTFTGFQNKAKATQALVDAKQIATAIDGIKAENGTPSEAAGGNVRTLSGVTGGTLSAIDANGYFTFDKDGFRAGRSAATSGKVQAMGETP
ncbi:MAG: prepilin-type N-terminal cleavage/methylation domain-containing protein [Dehalobacter sp.]|nr:prepilin-type N-terminal cleavage/methylation domain-containing protein [Dehalobacter sp.]